jgi:hypothetical protein
LSVEEEKKLSRLEKRLMANVDLGFGTDIYYMLGAPWMSAILQRGFGKHPQGVCLGNLDDYCAYPWWWGAKFIIPFGRNPTSGSLLGNSGKPVTLETLSLTKFLRHVFQGQETHDFRKPGTWEASDSRMRKIRGSWFGEEVESRTCGSPEPRAGNSTNFGRWLVRESVRDPVRDSRAKAFANQRRSESRNRESVGGPSSRVTREAIHEPTERQSQSCCPKKSGFWVWTSGRFVNM